MMNIVFAGDIREQHLILNPDWCVDVTLCLSAQTPGGNILFSGPIRVKLREEFDEVRMASPLLINNIQVSCLHGSHYSLVLATLAVTGS